MERENLNFAPFFLCSVWNVNENNLRWRSRVSWEHAMNTNSLSQNYFVEGVTDVTRKALFLVSPIHADFVKIPWPISLFLDRIEICPEKSQSIVHRTAATGASTHRRWRCERIIQCKHPTEYNFSIREHSRRTTTSRLRIAFVVIGTASADYRFVARVLRRCSCRQRRHRSWLWCGSNAYGFYGILPSALHDHRGHTKCCRFNVMPSPWTVRQHYFDRLRCSAVILSILRTFSHQIFSIILLWCDESLPCRRRQFECVPTEITRIVAIKTLFYKKKYKKSVVFLLDSNVGWRPPIFDKHLTFRIKSHFARLVHTTSCDDACNTLSNASTWARTVVSFAPAPFICQKYDTNAILQ